jgi:hypothetical protein
MAKNFLEQLSKIALFRTREQSLGIPQTLSGVSMAFDSGSGLGLERAVEDDREQLRGVELPTRLYLAGQTASGKLNQKRAKPDFISFALAYFFGQLSSQELAPGIYQHTITASDSLYLPSFTLLQRRGDSILKERFAGNLVESFSLELGESWVGLTTEIRGIGKRETSYEHEVVSAPANTLAITLHQNGVQGADSAERLENVFRVRARDYGSDVWSLCKVIAVSADAPAVLTLESAVGGSQNPIDFHIDYIPVEPCWCDFPESLDESPLRLVDAQVIVDGYFNGSTVTGGEVISNDLLAFSIQGRNELEIRKLADGSGELHASEAVRKGRNLAVRISERLRNTIRQWQADHPETEEVSLYLKIRGAEIAPGCGVNFGADMIFPKCGILKAPISVSGKVFSQEEELLVMDDGNCGGVFIRTWNQVGSYL